MSIEDEIIDAEWDDWTNSAMEELSPFTNIINKAVDNQVREETNTYKTFLMDAVKIAAYGKMKTHDGTKCRCSWFTKNGRCIKDAVKKPGNKVGDYYFCSYCRGPAAAKLNELKTPEKFNSGLTKKLSLFDQLKKKIDESSKTAIPQATRPVQAQRLVDVPNITPLVEENKKLYQDIKALQEQNEKLASMIKDIEVRIPLRTPEQMDWNNSAAYNSKRAEIDYQIAYLNQVVEQLLERKLIDPIIDQHDSPSKDLAKNIGKTL